MTKEEAANILESYKVFVNAGRRSEKTILALRYNEALNIAIANLRETAKQESKTTRIDYE